MKKILLIGLSLLSLGGYAQWGPDPQLAIPAGENVYATECATGSDGTTWYLMYHPNLVTGDEYDIQNNIYEYRLQIFDKDGNKKTGDDVGMLISAERNRSWTVVNQYLLIDRDNNAIVAVSDARNSTDESMPLSFTIYKISPEGEMLWGEDGVSVDGGYAYDVLAGMSMTQIDDGSYVFAWMRSASGGNNDMTIEMQRLSSDGKLLWDAKDVRLGGSNAYMYPYVVDAGYNQVILVYALGGNQDLYARKIDFDGTPVWSKDVRIYRGGWGGIPLWTKLSVVPSGDGGVLLSWNDDRNYTWVESAYVSYVTADGKLGFSGASEEGDVKVGYSGWKAFNCVVTPDPDNDGFIAAWRETESSQSYTHLKVQRISKSGELLWDEEGVTLTDDLESLYDLGLYTSFAYLSLHPGNEGQTGLFCQRRQDLTNYETMLIVLDNKTGEIWDKGQITIEERNSGDLTALMTSVCESEKFWIGLWEAGIPTDTDGPWVTQKHIQRINFDGTIGSSEVSEITKPVVSEKELTATFDGSSLILNAVTSENITVSLYDLSGRQVAELYKGVARAGRNVISLTPLSAGMYIVKVEAGQASCSLKINIQ